MIETTVPEINVAELMERVRAESKRPKPRRPRVSGPNGAAPALPPVAMLPSAPSVWIPGPVKSNRERLEQLVETARKKDRAGSRLPKFLRRFFRKQGGYNRAMLDAVSAIAKTNHDLTQRVADISTCLEQFNSWLLALHDQSDADANWMKAAAPVLPTIGIWATEIKQLEAELDGTRAAIETLGSEKCSVVEARRLGERVEASESENSERTAALRRRLEEVRQLAEERATAAEQRAAAAEESALAAEQRAIAAEQKATAAKEEAAAVEQRANAAALKQTDRAFTELREKTDSLRTALESVGIHLRNLQAQTDTVGLQAGALREDLGETAVRANEKSDDLQHQLEKAALHLRSLQTQADRLGVHINNLQGFVDQRTAETDAIHRGLEQRLADQAGLAQRITAFEERTVADGVLVKGELSEFAALFRRLLGDDLEKPIAPGKKAVVKTKTMVPGLDSFYVALENRFRGSRSEIKKRAQFYLPFIRKCGAGSSTRPVLDVGCGRGEWLELLKEQKLEGRGVDMNTAMVAQCKARRLKVELRDALEYLRSIRANTYGAITGFHIIEHLPFETLLELFRQARRVLKPGGVAIFESPNCKNLIVGACTFHIDPTHRHPVFPETAELMLASQGFEKIRIEYLSPVPNTKFSGNTPELATIKDLLYGPQDFGIIASKPRAR